MACGDERHRDHPRIVAAGRCDARAERLDGELTPRLSANSDDHRSTPASGRCGVCSPKFDLDQEMRSRADGRLSTTSSCVSLCRTYNILWSARRRRSRRPPAGGTPCRSKRCRCRRRRPPSPPRRARRRKSIKRDGARAPFELGKIASAIARAGAATGEFDADEARALADAVGRVLAHRHHGRRARHRDDPGQRRAHAGRRRLLRHRARLHRLPRPPRAAARRPQDAGRRRRVGRRVPRAEGLARQRQRQPGLFAGRADPQRLGQGRRQLLAVARLRAGDRPRAPRRRRPHPRPRHAGRLLRRLVAAPAAARGPERRAGQGRGGAAEAHVERGRPDRQLPRHAAERVGGRAGVLARSTPTWRRSSAATR